MKAKPHTPHPRSLCRVIRRDPVVQVMMLDGLELDKCNGLGGYDHWIKASQVALNPKP